MRGCANEWHVSWQLLLMKKSIVSSFQDSSKNKSYPRFCLPTPLCLHPETRSFSCLVKQLLGLCFLKLRFRSQGGEVRLQSLQGGFDLNRGETSALEMEDQGARRGATALRPAYTLSKALRALRPAGGSL